MSNFGFLKTIPEYALFADAAIEAEKICTASPAACVIGCRKAIELGVKWLYSVERKVLKRPYQETLSAMLHEDSFRQLVDHAIWRQLMLIVKTGNRAAHTETKILHSEALFSLRGLFEFIQWIDYCYGKDWTERTFSPDELPSKKSEVNIKKIKEQESLIVERDIEIERLRASIASLSEELVAARAVNQKTRVRQSGDMDEREVRANFIDMDMRSIGWVFPEDGENANVMREYEVEGMPTPSGKGKIDYLLMGADGKPLAIVEAKRPSVGQEAGREQARLYADCIEKKFGRRPLIFTTDGYETEFWDDRGAPPRKVFGIFGSEDLWRIINRRDATRPQLSSITVSDKITDRAYQKEAIRRVCASIDAGRRKHLLVMATGTGKTRTAASIVDVLSRAETVTNVLFLADRNALVEQALDGFKEYLPTMSLCDITEDRENTEARIIFSTYQTMINAIDSLKTKTGVPIFSPAHFDLIIIDESHRSIFRKYGVIFEYFDAQLIGLTATPRDDVSKSTYEFFELESNNPTFSYTLEDAVSKDHVLVPPYSYEVKTKFISEGIKYKDLSEEDKERFEEDFGFGDDEAEIPKSMINETIFNIPTIDAVITDLMTRGIKVDDGDKIGKTIIFAQNMEHAGLIVERFNILYPQYKGEIAARITYKDSYAKQTIKNFKRPDSMPQIAVSVDMMDTGIDVPECVNLVFFKVVRSKIKFWQMLGRGTRLCSELRYVDEMDGSYIGKRRFVVFDYCGNFEFFDEHPKGFESRSTVKSLNENIFTKRIELIAALHNMPFIDGADGFKTSLVGMCTRDVAALNNEQVAVRLVREYAEKYKTPEAYEDIDDEKKAEITKKLAPLIFIDDWDEAAKRFDALMYGAALAKATNKPVSKFVQDIINVATVLMTKTSIPQVASKMDVITQAADPDFWKSADVLTFEGVRADLRDLVGFVDGVKSDAIIIRTYLDDPVIDDRQGDVPLHDNEEFENYRQKVDRYIEANKYSGTAIYKLTHNIQLTKAEFGELERILTEELGSRQDCEEYAGDIVKDFDMTKLGIFVRRIAGVDHETVERAFSKFINSGSLNADQIAFVRKIIEYMKTNGVMEADALTRPPFDRPSILVLFDKGRAISIKETIDQFTSNAIVSA